MSKGKQKREVNGSYGKPLERAEYRTVVLALCSAADWAYSRSTMTWIKKNICRTAIVLALGVTTISHAQQNPPVETDARLHSNGNGWKLNKARISDKSLPRVLLIGDSILAGYQPFVIEALKDKAYIAA